MSVAALEWTWIGRCLPGPAPTVSDPRHRRWMRTKVHAHPTREIMLVLEGEHRYGVGERVHPARPGTVFLFAAGEAHDADYPPFSPLCRDLWLVLAPPHCVFINEACAGGGRPRILARRRPLGPAFAECLTASWDACQGESASPAAVRQLQAAVTMALLAALRSPLETGSADSRQRRAVDEIRRHIASNLGLDLSLKGLARLAGYAPEHFHRIFRQRTGLTLHAYVARLRLDRARQLLQGGAAVGAVAGELGFGSAAYFSRFFKRATGLAPTGSKTRPP